jgi:uncharacterized protein YndB with AHSA1/START domain
MGKQSLSFSVNVKAPQSEIYRAFTNATSMREWLCDVATVSPRNDGRLYMAWNNGFYVSGEYVSLEPDKSVVFTWRGKGDPFATQVLVTITNKGDEIQVELNHSGFGAGTEWENIIKEIQSGWETGLENLVSVLETGEDLRFTRRPMLGIMINDFNDEVAKELGIPTNKGIRIEGVLDGMGAKDSGLEANDVIVEMAGMHVEDWMTLANALQKYRAGDRVDVVYYRGGDKKNTSMQLSKRPLPEIPRTQHDLAAKVSKEFAKIHDKLDELFEDITESEASYKPAPEEWNVKENLAHLIQGERYTQNWISQLLGNQEHFTDDWEGNQYAGVAATAAAYPTLSEICDEYKRSMAETVALLQYLPDEFLGKKGSFWRLAHNLLDGTLHFDSHVDQISKLIQEVRQMEKQG